MSDETRVSVREFKNWLSGVLDFQPDDWVPNAEQWGKIRNKIDQLDETVDINQQPVQATQPVQAEMTQPSVGQPAPRNPRAHGPTLLDKQAPVKLPDETPPKPKQVTVKKTGQPQVIKGEGGGRVIDTGVVHEMGVIDTSETEYESSFK